MSVGVQIYANTRDEQDHRQDDSDNYIHSPLLDEGHGLDM